MNITDPPVAVRRIDTDRADVFAVEISGHITASDVENIYGLLEGAYQLHDKLDMLVRISDYEGVDWNAALRDVDLLRKTRILKHIRRYAVVGGPGWMGTMVGFFDPFFSIEMKHFDPADEPRAWAWIGAVEIPERI